VIPAIKGFIENSLIEWEGQIVSVVFLPRCNLRCRYCHASHLVLNPDSLESIPVQSVLECVARQRGWVDGVVITGGEPTLHGQSLEELVTVLKGIPTKVWLETNGTNPGVLQKLVFRGILSGVAMDIKAPLDEMKLRRIARAEMDLNLLRQSIRTIIERVPDHEFRTTLVPGYITKSDVQQIAQAAEGAKRLALQNFRPANCMDESLSDIIPFSAEEVDEMAEAAQPYVEQVVVRGVSRSEISSRIV